MLHAYQRYGAENLFLADPNLFRNGFLFRIKQSLLLNQSGTIKSANVVWKPDSIAFAYFLFMTSQYLKHFYWVIWSEVTSHVFEYKIFYIWLARRFAISYLMLRYKISIDLQYRYTGGRKCKNNLTKMNGLTIASMTTKWNA